MTVCFGSVYSSSRRVAGPEAVTAALYDASNLPWRQFATKMMVLVRGANHPDLAHQRFRDEVDSSQSQF